MTTLQKPIDFDAARQFFQALRKTKDTARLRAFFPSGHQFKAGDSGRKASPARSVVEQWQAEGRGVYMVINDGGDTDSEITACRALFCEWDDRPKEWQVIAWQELGLPEPTLQVDTGGKSIHSYWVFDQPVSPDRWRSLQKRLLEHADADRTLKNPSRVMRLPGTYHVALDGNLGEQVCIIHQSDAYYTPDELEASLPDEPTHTTLVQARQFTDYKPRTLSDIQDALDCIPSAVPKSGQYPFFRNLMWGLIQACEEAGGSADQAVAMMQRHSPAFAEAEQVARSNCSSVTAGTFWYFAREHGWRAPRTVSKVVVDNPTTAIERDARPLKKLEANELLLQLRAEANLRYNVFTQQIERDGAVLEGAEHYYLELAEQGSKISKEVALDCLVKVAKANPYDPIKVYLEHVAGHVQPTYIDRLASTYLRPADAELKEPTLYDHMIRCTLIAAVRRIYEPGSKHDNATVLMGEQGARKSSFWAAIGGDFFSDALRDISSKDDLMVLHRSWIMEWAELDHITSKKHAGMVKAFLSQSTDMFRVPYGKATEAFPRRCIIVGSTNRDSGFLVDETGNRRFWVIPVTCTLQQPIDVSSLLKERDAIWSAAVAAYRNGEPSVLTAEQEAMVASENEDYLVESPWRAPIEAWLLDPCNRLKEITTDVLLTQAIAKPIERQSRADQMQVASILRELGYDRRRQRVNGVLKWVYFRDSRA
jgi:predicted P-loop ATPase